MHDYFFTTKKTMKTFFATKLNLTTYFRIASQSEAGTGERRRGGPHLPLQSVV